MDKKHITRNQLIQCKTFLCLLLLFALISNLVFCTSVPLKDEEKNAQQVYQEARENMIKDRFLRAIELYRLLKNKFPFSEFTENAILELSYSYLMEVNYGEPAALIELAEFQRLFPTSKKIDFAVFLSGLISEQQSAHFFDGLVKDQTNRGIDLIEDAVAKYQYLIVNYQNSPYTKKASARTRHLRLLIDKHNLLISEFYFKRNLYIASIRRAQDIVRQSLSSDIKTKAFKIMISSYEALGLNNQKIAAEEAFNKDKSLKVKIELPPLIKAKKEIENISEALKN